MITIEECFNRQSLSTTRMIGCAPTLQAKAVLSLQYNNTIIQYNNTIQYNTIQYTIIFFYFSRPVSPTQKSCAVETSKPPHRKAVLLLRPVSRHRGKLLRPVSHYTGKLSS